MIAKVLGWMTVAATVVASLLGGCSARAEEMALGAALPDVTVPDQDGKPVRLAEVAKEGFTLVYFYPKADTPGCTKQACSLRDAYAKLGEKGVRIFGVSGDDVAAQKAFQEKYRLPFPLLADSQGKLIDAFGVPRTGSFAKRQAYLFRDGKLIWRDLSASTEEQAADVLTAIAELAPKG